MGRPGIQAVLFDLDGTLIDSAPDLGAAADKMRTDRGLPSLPSMLYRPMAGAGARGMLGVAFGTTPEAADFAELKEEFLLNYEKRMLATTIVFAGVVELVAAMQARSVPWGVVTNKISRFTDPLTRTIPLFASARAIVSGDTTPFAKPHPEPLFEAARRLGVTPECCACLQTLGFVMIELQFGVEENATKEKLDRLKSHIRSLASLHDILTLETLDGDGSVDTVDVKSALEKMFPLMSTVLGGRCISLDADSNVAMLRAAPTSSRTTTLRPTLLRERDARDGS